MPTLETHPVMKVNEAMEGRTRIYELVLSRANLNHLLAGCPDVDCLVGTARAGIRFRLFVDPGGRMPTAFESDIEGYHAYLGAPVEPLPPDVKDEEFEKLAKKTDENMVNAIRDSGKIPMEMRTSLGTVNVGYVKIRIEE